MAQPNCHKMQSGLFDELGIDAQALIDLSCAAGEEIMKIYEKMPPDGSEKATYKKDRTPVTEADYESERIILSGLRSLYPDIMVVSEEEQAARPAFSPEQAALPPTLPEVFFLVDPLDGTREFLDKNGEFTVNIALMVKNKPVFGVILAPALDILYYGGRKETEQGAFKRVNGADQPISCRPQPAQDLTVVMSRRHGDLDGINRALSPYAVTERINAGSSLKFCLLAEGKADAYPRLGRTMEWDTAAGQAILEGAGGEVCHLDRRLFDYGKRQDYANPSFVAWGFDPPALPEKT